MMKVPIHAEQDLPLLLTVPQAAKILNLGRNRVYALAAGGTIPCVRFGTTVRIPLSALARWVDEQEKGTTAR